jgi:long-chain acyl-CoA synthetase
MNMLASLGEILPLAAQRFGNKVALIFEGRELTFTDLDKLSNRLANGLVSLGVKPGDRVTLYSSNCWEWIVSYYGALKAGAVINPLNVMLTAEETEYVVKDCGAKVIIASKDKGEALLGIEARTSVGNIILFGEDTLPGALSFRQIMQEASDKFDAVQVKPESTSTIGYTSGTTGHPKGAMLTHRGVMLNSAMTGVMHVRTCADIVVSALPCAHVYGNVVMNGAFLYGMTLVLHRVFDAKAVLESIQSHRATMLEGVPTMYMYLLSYPDLGKYDLSSLTRCTVGGQTMPVAKMEQVENRFGCPLIELWGMTEIGGLGTTHTFYGPNKHGSIGIALPHVEIRIADVADASRTLPAGEVGELMVRGPIVMQGYYGNEAASREALEPDGWLHSGDVARMDEDGCIHVVDRKKDMIITAGFNIYPAEIERVVAAHPSVSMVAVGSIPDEEKGELAKAYIVLAENAHASAEDIIGFCRLHLANYKVPRAVQFVKDLPKTSTGKVMRRALKSMDADRQPVE